MTQELFSFLQSSDLANVKLGLGWLMNERKCTFEVHVERTSYCKHSGGKYNFTLTNRPKISIKTIDFTKFCFYLDRMAMRVDTFDRLHLRSSMAKAEKISPMLIVDVSETHLRVHTETGIEEIFLEHYDEKGRKICALLVKLGKHKKGVIP